MQKIVLLLTLFLFSFSGFAGTSRFCNWATKDKILTLEAKLLRANDTYVDSDLIRLDRLQKYIDFEGAASQRNDIFRATGRKRGFSADVHPSINKDNIDDMFVETLSNGEFRAKSITHIGIDNEVRVSHWATATDGVPNQVHHREVIAEVLERRGNRLINGADQQSSAVRMGLLMDEGDEYIRQAEKLRVERNSSSYDPGVLRQFHGFRLRGSRVNGQMKVTTINVNSSETRAVVSQANSNPNYRINPQDLARQIRSVYNSIDPAVRDIRAIEIPNDMRDILVRQGDYNELSRLLREIRDPRGRPPRIRHFDNEY